MKLFAALRAYGDWYREVLCQVRMITVTAPGVDRGLPWDEDHCAQLGAHRHSGELGCRVVPAAAGTFNKLAPAWWSELHREARQAATRAVGTAPEMLARIYELQKRGVLHLHLVVGYSIPGERAAADRYVAELSRRAPRHGFGYVDRKVQVKEPTAAAAYLSSYFVNGKGTKKQLSESVQDRRMPRSIIYVASWLSRRSGITMRSLRLKRYAWQLWRNEVEPQGLGLEVHVLDIWHGLIAGRTLVQVVSGCL
jgi:hypothetical protein